MMALQEVPVELNGPVVVVDVLRAFTTTGWVLAGGASQLLLAATDEEALALKRKLGPDAVAIRDGELLPGFDLGNSPGQVRRADLRGRPVVARTTNGTTAVHAVKRAPLVLCASLVNASATARALQDRDWDDVVYVITGDRGRADEDLACAQHIQAIIDGADLPRLTVDRVRSSPAADSLRQAVIAGYRGVAEDDIDLATQLDVLDFAMAARWADGHVSLSAR